MENQQQEALDVAVQLEKGFITLGKTARALRYEAAETIRRLHARVEELEKDRENAKRLASKIWNQHPEARDTIEKATGAWLVFGQDVETDGVSAQRITQGKDHIAQNHKMVSAPVVLPDGWTIVPVEPTPQMVEAGATERITPHITAGHGAIAAFKAMLEHAPEYPALAATPTTAAQSEVPKVGSDWRHKNGNTYRVVAIANDCDAHFSERYPVTVVYQGENGKMWARRADDWHRSMTHDATAPSTALVERPG